MPRETQTRLNQNAPVQESNAQQLFTQVTSRPVDTTVSPAQSNMMRLAGALEGLTPGIQAFEQATLNGVRRDVAQEVEDNKRKLIDQGLQDALANPEARGESALRYLNPEYKAAYFDAMSMTTATDIDREFALDYNKNSKDPAYDVKAAYDRILKEKTAGISDGQYLQKVVAQTAKTVGTYSVHFAQTQQKMADQKMMDNVNTAFSNVLDSYQSDTSNPEMNQGLVSADKVRDVYKSVREQAKATGTDPREIERMFVQQMSSRGLINEDLKRILYEKDASGHAAADSPEVQKIFTADRIRRENALDAASKKRRDLESIHVKKDIVDNPDNWSFEAINAYVKSEHLSPDEGMSIYTKMMDERRKRQEKAQRLADVLGPNGKLLAATDTEYKKVLDEHLVNQGLPVLAALSDAVRSGDETSAGVETTRIAALISDHSLVKGYTTPHPLMEVIKTNMFSGAVSVNSKTPPAEFLAGVRLFDTFSAANSDLVYRNFDDETRLKIETFKAQLREGKEPVQAYANAIGMSAAQKLNTQEGVASPIMRDTFKALWSGENEANSRKPKDSEVPIGFEDAVMRRANKIKALSPSIGDVEAVTQAKKAELQNYFYDEDSKGWVRLVSGYNQEDSQSIFKNIAQKQHPDGGTLSKVIYDAAADKYTLQVNTADGPQYVSLTTEGIKSAVREYELTPAAVAANIEEYNGAEKWFKEQGLFGKPSQQVEDWIKVQQENARHAIDSQPTYAGKRQLIEQYAAMDKYNILGFRNRADEAIASLTGSAKRPTVGMDGSPVIKSVGFPGVNKFLAAYGIFPDAIKRNAGNAFSTLANLGHSAGEFVDTVTGKATPLSKPEYVNDNYIDRTRSKDTLNKKLNELRADPKFSKPKLISKENAEYAASKADQDPAFAVTMATEDFAANITKDNKGRTIGFGWNFDMIGDTAALKHLQSAGFPNPAKTLERLKANDKTLKITRDQGYALYAAHREGTDKLMAKVIGNETWDKLGEHHPVKIILRDFAYNMAPGADGEKWKKFQFIQEIRKGGDIGTVLTKLYQTTVSNDKANQTNWSNRLHMWDIALTHSKALKDLFQQAATNGGRLQ
jgi:hypothetical protein